MEPNLLVGDRLFVTKYSYGYSKHSFPFSPPIFSGRILLSQPKRGDVIVFKTPADNRTDYIKRLIGIPGDEIQFIDGNLYLNGNAILKTIKSKNDKIFCGNQLINVNTYEEKLPTGKVYTASYNTINSYSESDKFVVPNNHYFFLGDNRDCSKDSRFLLDVGYVHQDNLIGKAQRLFFSSDTRKGSILFFWKWPETLRLNRFFKKIN
tara:strand:- start:282 stop:902 length:621 start_codon:yes stop_codon:yes gene_type:complete